mmetsp:Transcript_34867/g.91188  ORF Transcript_34867/g.91188 Transcript_34867/m.91188 type:complete len:571 (+) Transcript_34867:244-1956(+)
MKTNLAMLSDIPTRRGACASEFEGGRPRGQRAPETAVEYFRLSSAGANPPSRAGGEVVGPLARDHPLDARGARPLAAEVPLLVEPNLLHGFRTALEELPGPASAAGVQDVLYHKLDALAVAALPLQRGKPGASLGEGLPGNRQRRRLHGVAHGHEELAGALDRHIGRHAGGLVAEEKGARQGAHHTHRQQVAQEEVAYELHVGERAALPGLLELLAVDGRLRRRARGLEVFELTLDGVQQRRPEGHGLAALGGREFLKRGLEREDEVGVRLAVVRLGEGLLEEQLDHQLELLRGLDLDLADLLRHRCHVLRADLVQQAPHVAAKISDVVGRVSSNSVGLPGRGRQSLRRLSPQRAVQHLLARERLGGGRRQPVPEVAGLDLRRVRHEHGPQLQRGVGACEGPVAEEEAAGGGHARGGLVRLHGGRPSRGPEAQGLDRLVGDRLGIGCGGADEAARTAVGHLRVGVRGAGPVAAAARVALVARFAPRGHGRGAAGSDLGRQPLLRVHRRASPACRCLPRLAHGVEAQGRERRALGGQAAAEPHAAGGVLEGRDRRVQGATEERRAHALPTR